MTRRQAHGRSKQGEPIETRSKGSEHLLQFLMHAIPDLIWLKDPAGVYMPCNRRFEAFFGQPEANIVGKLVRPLVLIVDDEPPNQLILEDLLGRHYAVHAVTNGRQALEYLLTKSAVALILGMVQIELEIPERLHQILAPPQRKRTNT